jgi:hypothetical protein
MMLVVGPGLRVGPRPRHLIIITPESFGSRFELVSGRGRLQYADQAVVALLQDFGFGQIVAQVVAAWAGLLSDFLVAARHRGVEWGWRLRFFGCGGRLRGFVAGGGSVAVGRDREYSSRLFRNKGH